MLRKRLALDYELGFPKLKYPALRTLSPFASCRVQVYGF